MIHRRLILPLLTIALLQGCAASTSQVQQPAAAPPAVSASETKPVAASEPAMQTKKPNVTVEVIKTLPGRRPAVSKTGAEQVGTWAYIKVTNTGNAPSTNHLAISCTGNTGTGVSQPQGGALLDSPLNPGESVKKIFWMQGATIAPKDISCSISGPADLPGK